MSGHHVGESPFITPAARWVGELRAARGPVDAWIQEVASDAWCGPRGGRWTRKDLLGHLTAWSEFLLDQVEALRDNRPDVIEAIQVDAWNAVEVERRRHWTVEATITGWRRSAQRADEVISALSPAAWTGRWRVAWSAEPVSIDNLIELVVVHLRQHRSELAEDT
jgi:hypothetical protein